MRSAASPAAARDAAGIHAAIERFLKASRNPALLEPGEEIFTLAPDSFALQLTGSRLTIEAWNETRNLARRITAIGVERRGRMELIVERFARAPGAITLVDLAHPDSQDASRHGGRTVFRERFRRFLTRQFPSWTLADLSVEADLEHSLSPAYPRAFLRLGQSGVAAIAAPPDGGDPSSLLSFGLIWLDYLRHRESRCVVERLVLFIPTGSEKTTCHRIPFLNPASARADVFAYSPEDFTAHLDPGDSGNLETKLEVCRTPGPEAQAWADRISDLPDVERVETSTGAISLRVRGIEFARAAGQELLFGLRKRAAARESNLPEIARLARELARMRSTESQDKTNPLYRQDPEAWLASQARVRLDRLDASLKPVPLYGQVPACAGGQRGLIDLLAVDTSGRLAVIELKASPDIHLPLQALDYWMRVKWHLDRDEFTAKGYFPGIALRKDPPRMLLVSPALDFHPTTEIILRHFSTAVEVERIGVGANWRAELQTMFRLRGAEKPL